MLKRVLLVVGVLLALEAAPATALDLNTYINQKNHYYSDSYLPPEIQTLLKKAWQTSDTLSPAVIFLSALRKASPVQSMELLVQTPTQIQEQALQAILFEWLLYSQHEWPDLSTQAETIAKQLQMTSPTTQKSSQRFREFMNTPTFFANSQDNFEQLLWHTHQALLAFHVLNTTDLAIHTDKMLALGEKLELPSAVMEAKMLNVLMAFSVGDVSLIGLRFPEYNFLLDQFRTETHTNQDDYQREMFRLFKLHLEALIASQNASSDFLTFRCFMYLATFWDRPASYQLDSDKIKQQIHPWFVQDLMTIFDVRTFPRQYNALQNISLKTDPTLKHRHFLIQTLSGIANIQSSEGRTQLLDSLTYFESQPPGLYPLLLHYLLGKTLLDQDRYNPTRGENHLLQALSAADNLHKPNFKALIYFELAKMELSSRSRPEKTIHYINQALPLLQGRIALKFELRQLQAEAYTKSNQQKQAALIYHQLLKEPRFRDTALVCLYQFQDAELLIQLPQIFKVANDDTRNRLLHNVVYQVQQNSTKGKSLSAFNRQLLSSLVRLLTPEEKKQDAPWLIMLEEKTQLKPDAALSKTFELNQTTLRQLKTHPDKRYVPRLVLLLQRSKWDSTHREAWQILKQLDVNAAKLSLRNFFLTYPNQVIVQDFMDLWNLGYDLSPQEWWRIVPKLGAFPWAHKERLDEQIIPWLSQNSSEALKYFNLAVETEIQTFILEMVTKSFSTTQTLNIFKTYMAHCTVKEQSSLLYQLQTLNNPTLIPLFKAKLSNPKLQDMALMGLANVLQEPDVYPILQNALKDKHLWPHALEAIRQNKNKAFISLLRPYLRDPDPEKSEMALIALVELGADDLEPFIQQSLKQHMLNKAELRFALQEFASEDLILNTLLPLALAEKDPWLRREKYNTLRNIRSRKVALTIWDKIPAQPDLLSTVWPTLHKYLTPEDLPDILRILIPLDVEDQWFAIQDLIKQPVWSVNALHEYILNRYSKFTEEQADAILDALGTFGSPIHIPFMLKQLDSPSGNIQFQALSALKKMRYQGKDSRIQRFAKQENPQIASLAQELIELSNAPMIKDIYLTAKELEEQCPVAKFKKWNEKVKTLSEEQSHTLKTLLFEKKDAPCKETIIEAYWSNRKKLVTNAQLLQWMHERKDPRLSQFIATLDISEFRPDIMSDDTFQTIYKHSIPEAIPLLKKILDFENPLKGKPKVDENGVLLVTSDYKGFISEDIRDILVILSYIDATLYVQYAHQLLKNIDPFKREGAASAIVEISCTNHSQNSLVKDLQQAIDRNDEAVLQGLMLELLIYDENDRKDALACRDLALKLAQPHLIKKHPDILYVLGGYRDPFFAPIIRPYLTSPGKSISDTAWSAYVRSVGAAALPEINQQLTQKNITPNQALHLLVAVHSPKADEMAEQLIKSDKNISLSDIALGILHERPSLSPWLLDRILLEWQQTIKQEDKSQQNQFEENFLAHHIDPELIEKKIQAGVPVETIQLLKIKLYLNAKQPTKAIEIAKTLLENPAATAVAKLSALKSTWEHMSPSDSIPYLEKMLPIAQNQLSDYQYNQLEKPLVFIYQGLAKSHTQLNHTSEASHYEFLWLQELGRK